MSWIFPWLKKTTNPMRVVLCVGHSRIRNGTRDCGAVSVGGVSEWHYNRDLASRVAKRLRRQGHFVHVIDSYGERGYTESCKYASERVEELRGDVVLELHFNAAHGNARGHEWLFQRGDDRSMLLAASFEMEFKELLPELRNRYVKPITKGERGGAFLDHAPRPAVICEPFFGSNAKDWEIAVSRKDTIAKAYTNALTKWWGVDQKKA